MGEGQSSRELEYECGRLGLECWQRHMAYWEVCKPLFICISLGTDLKFSFQYIS